MVQVETLDPSLVAALDDFMRLHSGEPGVLIPTLQKAQDTFGWLPEAVLRRISLKLGISLSEVTGVVSFYSYFSTVPRGRNVVRVCLGTACYVRGGKEVLNAIEHSLGTEVGHTTRDRCFSLQIGRCFGACGVAPVVMVNDDVHQRVKPTGLRQLFDRYRGHEDEEEFVPTATAVEEVGGAHGTH